MAQASALTEKMCRDNGFVVSGNQTHRLLNKKKIEPISSFFRLAPCHGMTANTSAVYAMFCQPVATCISLVLLMDTDGSRNKTGLQVRCNGLRSRPFADEPLLPFDEFLDRPLVSKPASASPREKPHFVFTPREISNAARFLAQWFAGASGFRLPCEIGGGVGRFGGHRSR